jgi:hypothetical protein
LSRQSTVSWWPSLPGLEDRTMSDTQWQVAAQAYLAKLAQAEYRAGIWAHTRAGRKDRTYRHCPSDYHRSLVAVLGQNDEEAFKAIKGLQGYASILGV